MEQHLEELDQHYFMLHSRHLTESELCTIVLLEESATARRHKINNYIPREFLQNALIWHDIFVIAYSYGYTFNSGYRCEEVNNLVKGVADSRHKKCLACDFGIKDITSNTEIQMFIRSVNRLLNPYHHVDYYYRKGNMLHIQIKVL